MKDRASQQVRFRKAKDRSLVLVLVGCILLLPPVAAIFQLEATWNGVPATLMFVFTIWGVLIVGAAMLSRSLNQEEEQSAPGDPLDEEA